MEDNKKKFSELAHQNDELELLSQSMNLEQYLGSVSNLPDLETHQEYDYEKDVDNSLIASKEIIEALAEDYLGDVPALLEKKYIKTKIAEDSCDYANSIFYEKIMKRQIIIQMKFIERGEAHPQAFEALTKAIKEANILAKDKSKQKQELQNYYKNLRNDFGVKELSEANKGNNMDDEDKDNMDDGIIMNTNLNDLIDKLTAKNKEDKEEEELDDF